MRRLNKKYRQIDKPTTVLSFFYGKEKKFYGQANFPLGEVFICPSEAKKQNIKIEDLVKHGVINILSEIPTTKTGSTRHKRGKPDSLKNRQI